MKKAYIVFLIAIIGSVLVGQVQFSQYQTLLEKSDELTSFNTSDVSAKYTIETERVDRTKDTQVIALFRRDKTTEFLILKLEPISEKGKGFLQTGANLEFYDPATQSTITTNSSMRISGSFQVGDIKERTQISKNYMVIAQSTATLGKYNCTILELKAKSNTVLYSKLKVWISEDNLIRRIEDYSLSGTLVRTTNIIEYQLLGKSYLATKIKIYNHNLSKQVDGKTIYETTTITVTNPSLQKIPDIYYTIDFLRKAGAK